MPSHTSANQYPCFEEITHNSTIQVFKYVLILPCCHKYGIYALLTLLASKIETVQQLQIEIYSIRWHFVIVKCFLSWDDNELNSDTKLTPFKGEVSAAEAS